MEENNRILIVDDNHSIHRDFKKVLSNPRAAEKRKLAEIEQGLFSQSGNSEKIVDPHPNYVVDSAFQGQEAIEMVGQAAREGNPYALIFMDVRMPPGWDGIETIGKIWQEYPDIEMVICTAYSDYSWERILSQLGTTDQLLFLRKPFDTTAVKQMALSQTQKWNLNRRAKHYVAQLQEEIQVRKKSEADLKHLAHHDPLTGLANRAQFAIDLEKAIGHAREQNSKFGIFLIDLDRFKEINDTLGYHNGDLLLRQFADRIKGLIHQKVCIARFGCDEFVTLVPDVNTIEEASEIATRIRQGIVPNFTIENLHLEITARIGIVLYPDHGDDMDTLMRRADITTSAAKKSDSGFTFYQAKYDTYSPRRLMLLGQLRQAILNEELVLYYQPKISLESAVVVGVEALVRWIHPQHGRILPDEFIPIAERSGLIKPLSLWVLHSAPKQWAQWCRKGVDVAFSVNLSVRDLFDSTLPDTIAALLEEYAMPPHRLVLEITESAMMEDPEQVRGILMRLSEMGVKLAIDDFGTGYSSLAYLKNLPVDEIKIDKSFVSDMVKNGDDATIVKSTIDLGHTMGLRVTAEGVENTPTWDKLKSLNCDLAQGNYMGLPKSPEKIEQWFNESDFGLKALQRGLD